MHLVLESPDFDLLLTQRQLQRLRAVWGHLNGVSSHFERLSNGEQDIRVVIYDEDLVEF